MFEVASIATVVIGILLLSGCASRAELDEREGPAGQAGASAPSGAQRIAGYRGIWFTLGQPSEFGDKYSGGLGTYTANHIPMAVYVAKVDKTFFVYGGTTAAGDRRLLCMAGEYDHVSGLVPRPIVVHDKLDVDDPHDNPSINVGTDGRLWVFISGRGKVRPGYKYRSTKPYCIDEFERVEESEMTYPQLHVLPGGDMIHLFTKYTAGRELYWETSVDGRTWSEDRKLAGMGGHYQVSNSRGGVVGSAFMYHPGGNVDRRTNLYYVQTADAGQNWTTVDAKPLETPVTSVRSAALIIDYEAQGLNVYIHDLNFDGEGRPAILYITSKGAAPGPQNGPYTWRVTRWTGHAWQTSDVTTSDHNYDTGNLTFDPDGTWRIIGPTGVGPQPHGAGGEMSAWISRDAGATWSHAVQITKGSEFNHSYARRPHEGRDPFFTFWADGDPSKVTPSRLYFTNREGDSVWQLPYDMPSQTATPEKVSQ